jgi:hypothetical protein
VGTPPTAAMRHPPNAQQRWTPGHGAALLAFAAVLIFAFSRSTRIPPLTDDGPGSGPVVESSNGSESPSRGASPVISLDSVKLDGTYEVRGDRGGAT